MADINDPQKLTLRAELDVSGIQKGASEGAAEIKKFGATVEQSTGKAGRSLEGLGAASQKATEDLGRSQKAYLANLQRVIAAEEAGGRNTVEYQRKLAELRGVPSQFADPLLKQLEAVQAAQAAAGTGLGKFDKDLTKTGMTAKATAAALRQVPSQFTDIVVSLAGGQAPMTVLLQQGGQLKDVFGGVGAAARALGGYIAGLLSPLTVLVAAIGAVAYGYKQGSDETTAFDNALIQTGKSAGYTRDQLQGFSAEIAKSANVTKGAAADALALAVNAGLSGDSIRLAADAAVRLEKSLGVGTDKTIAQFKSLGEEPLKAAVKLNEATNFLTTASYKQIKALEEQGNKQEAVRVAQEAYSDAVKNRTGEVVQNLGYVEAAYGGIKDILKSILDYTAEIGRGTPNTAEAILSATRQRIAELEQKKAPGRGIFSGLSSSEEKELAFLRAKEQADAVAVKSVQDQAAARAKAAASARDLAKWDSAGLEFLKKGEQLRRELDKARGEANPLLATGVITQEDLQKRLSDIREKYRDREGESRTGKQLENQSRDIEKELSKQISAYTIAERELDAVRSAGLLSESEYYDAKRAYLQSTTNLSVTAIDAEIALRQNAKLSVDAQLDNQKKLIDLQAKRVELINKTAGEQGLLDIQESVSARNKIVIIEQLKNAERDYLESQRRNLRQQLDLMGVGDEEAKRLQGRTAIVERYADRVRQATDSLNLSAKTTGGTPTSDAQEKFNAEIAVIKAALPQALAEWDKYYEDLKTKQGDWRVGARKALDDYIDGIHNVSKTTENALAGAFKGAEDAFVEFAKTGKIEMSDLTDNIIAGLIRIGIQKNITGPIAEYAKSNDWVSAIASYFTANAKGGVYASPSLSSYSNQVHDTPQVFAFAKGAGVFGEAGAEAIMPLTRTADGNLGVRASGNMAGNVVVNVIESNERGGQVENRNQNGTNVIDVFVAQVKGAIANDIRRGSGEVPSALRDTYALNRAPAGY